jgi:hypothetical protein
VPILSLRNHSFHELVRNAMQGLGTCYAMLFFA